MHAQLVFDLTAPPALGREDFFVSEANRLAVAALTGSVAWQQGKLLLLGPEGSGKTHLAGMWAADHAARVIDTVDLMATDLLEGMVPSGAMVVEDAQRVAGRPEAEQALFHLHNMMLAGGHALLMTANNPPRQWGLGLADLHSRMEATATASLSAPDDALLAAVLVKLFADRQLLVPAALIPWLVTRMERSFVAARSVVAAIDGLALASGRAVTRAMAAEVLDRRGAGEP